jgi:hypothetical protein
MTKPQEPGPIRQVAATELPTVATEEQLELAMRAIATEGCGLLIHEQRSRSSRRIESLGRDLRNRQR